MPNLPLVVMIIAALEPYWYDPIAFWPSLGTGCFSTHITYAGPL